MRRAYLGPTPSYQPQTLDVLDSLEDLGEATSSEMSTYRKVKRQSAHQQLVRLEKAGLVEHRKVRRNRIGAPAHAYRLTTTGRWVLYTELKRRHGYIAAARSVGYYQWGRPSVVGGRRV